MKGNEKIVNRNQSQQDGGHSRQSTWTPRPPALRALGQAHRPPGTVAVDVSKGPLVFSGRVSPTLWNFVGASPLGRGLTPSPVRQLKFKLDPSAEPEKAALPFSSQPKRWALAPVGFPPLFPSVPHPEHRVFSPGIAGPAEGNSLLLTLVPEAPLLFFQHSFRPHAVRWRTIGLIQTEKRGKMWAKDFRGGYILIIYF